MDLMTAEALERVNQLENDLDETDRLHNELADKCLELEKRIEALEAKLASL